MDSSERSMSYLDKLGGIFGLIAMLAGCASPPVDSIELMPAPEVYEYGKIDPFSGLRQDRNLTYPGMLYATNRQPAEEEGKAYLNDRGQLQRLGMATIVGKKSFIDWEEARRVSLLKDRGAKYPLKVDGVEVPKQRIGTGILL